MSLTHVLWVLFAISRIAHGRQLRGNVGQVYSVKEKVSASNRKTWNISGAAAPASESTELLTSSNETRTKEDLRLWKEWKEKTKKSGELLEAADQEEQDMFNNALFPLGAVGRVDTAKGSCTGTMIGPRLMLTALHCLHWESPGMPGWMKFTPGYNNGYAPYGTANATYFYWTDGVMDIFNASTDVLSDVEMAFDYVVVLLDKNLHAGFVDVATYSTDWDNGKYWAHIGYPGEVGAGGEPSYFTDGAITSVTPLTVGGQTGYIMTTNINTTAGQSGGPLSTYGYYLVGVMSTRENGYNEASGGPALYHLVQGVRKCGKESKCLV